MFKNINRAPKNVKLKCKVVSFISPPCKQQSHLLHWLYKLRVPAHLLHGLYKLRVPAPHIGLARDASRQKFNTSCFLPAIDATDEFCTGLPLDATYYRKRSGRISKALQLSWPPALNRMIKWQLFLALSFNCTSLAAKSEHSFPPSSKSSYEELWTAEFLWNGSEKCLQAPPHPFPKFDWHNWLLLPLLLSVPFCSPTTVREAPSLHFLSSWKDVITWRRHNIGFGCEKDNVWRKKVSKGIEQCCKKSPTGAYDRLPVETALNSGVSLDNEKDLRSTQKRLQGVQKTSRTPEKAAVSLLHGRGIDFGL